MWSYSELISKIRFCSVSYILKEDQSLKVILYFFNYSFKFIFMVENVTKCGKYDRKSIFVVVFVLLSLKLKKLSNF